MKYLTLAAVALLGLFAADKASAQCIYDPVSGATALNYYTGAGNTLAGDIIQVTPSTATFNTVTVLYVATTFGTYDVEINGYNGHVPCNSFQGIPPGNVPFTTMTGTVNVPLPAPGETFPQVWELTFTAPCTAIGNTFQSFSFETTNTTDPTSNPAFFSVAYANSADVNGFDINGFSIDTNVDGLLEPCAPGNEWYNFGAGTNWNVMFSLCGECEIEDSLIQPQAFSARKVSGKAISQLKKPVLTRFNDSL